MRLGVLHRTRYVYGTAVKESFNEARLAPFSADGQKCESFLLKILPTGKLRHYFDFFRNTVHFFEVAESHSTLVVEAQSEVVTTAAQVLPPHTATTPLIELDDCKRLSQCYDYLQPSPSVDVSPEVWRLALDVAAGHTDTWAAAMALTEFVHREFRYDPNSTSVTTHMREVLLARQGVCQDFAHVLIGLGRALKIPTRYASGYLYNGPAETLRGAQASHAWVEVFLPGIGWRGLDPTNNRQPDEHYIKIAHGRDYGDALPLRGHYRGAPAQALTVEVKVERLDG